ncbi:MAG: hypothetical protein HQ506_05195 [Candidatus Marinimicrobia bacterium]|nr:hypothetical protein [Candidatus Neomarinimicrobiota bacterium]
MGYWIDVTGHPNILIDDVVIPRVGETITLVEDTLEGQEENLVFTVRRVIHTLGPGLITELPVIVLEPMNR